MPEWLLIPGAAVLSLLLAAGLRRYALSKSLMDVPNARSSHSVPTPRGGGVSIVVVFLVALFLLTGTQLVSLTTMAALAGAGVIIAVIGFMDDHGHIAARWRLLGHFAAAIWALIGFGGLPPIDVFGTMLNWELSAMCSRPFTWCGC